jgi:hypothetical protein
MVGVLVTLAKFRAWLSGGPGIKYHGLPFFGMWLGVHTKFVDGFSINYFWWIVGGNAILGGRWLITWKIDKPLSGKNIMFIWR